MVEVIAFPDAESFSVAFLKAQFTERDIATRVGTKLPKAHTAADSFVRVSRSGGVSRDIVTDSPMILVECFGPDTVTASDTAKVTRALMLAAARLSDEVTRVQDSGGVAFLPDPDTGQPRYQFVVALDLRGSAI